MGDQQCLVVVGLGFGDEGKGRTVAELTTQHGAHTIVRFNGGPQARHHVVHQGRSHAFSQFGAGTAVSPTVHTLLSRQMAVAPGNILREAAVHADNGCARPLARLQIDARCPVVTWLHRLLNRAREVSRGDTRLGSVGMGVGEVFTQLEQQPGLVLRAGQLLTAPQLRSAVDDLFEHTAAALQAMPEGPELDAFMAAHSGRLLQPQQIADELLAAGRELRGCVLSPDAADAALQDALTAGTTILEGAQGALLDPQQGTTPHCTRGRTLCAHAAELLATVDADLPARYIGVTRPYAHRHGAGPLPSERPAWQPLLPEAHNRSGRWQGAFRVGPFDAVLARHAAEHSPELDQLVVTNIDRLSALPELLLCERYDTVRGEGESLTAFLQRARPCHSTAASVAELLMRISDCFGVPLLAWSAAAESGWEQPAGQG